MKRHEAKGAACGPSSKRTTMMSRLSSQRRCVFFLLALVLAVVTQSNAAEVRCKTAELSCGRTDPGHTARRDHRPGSFRTAEH